MEVTIALLPGPPHETTPYERRPDPGRAGAERRRPIILAISEQGVHTLRHLNLDHEVSDAAIPMPMIGGGRGERTGAA